MLEQTNHFHGRRMLDDFYFYFPCVGEVEAVVQYLAEAGRGECLREDGI